MDGIDSIKASAEQPHLLLQTMADAVPALDGVLFNPAFYDEEGRLAGWQDRNGISYRYSYD